MNIGEICSVITITISLIAFLWKAIKVLTQLNVTIKNLETSTQEQGEINAIVTDRLQNHEKRLYLLEHEIGGHDKHEN